MSAGGPRPFVPIGRVAALVEDDASDPGFDPAALFARLWPHRVFLAGVAIGTAVAAFALSFALPSVYEATATLVEAQSSNSNSSFGQLGVSAEQYGLVMGSRPSSTSTYPAILRSHRLLSRLLQQRFATARGQVALIDQLVGAGAPAQRVEHGVRTLRKRIDAALDRRTGILTLRVQMNDPALAAGVATAACAELQDIVMRSMSTQAGENRRFTEGRLQETKRELSGAENRLRSFRENNLRGNSPRLLTEDARLVREVRTQEEIMLTLTRHSEIARLEEQRDVPVINVLDPAVPPVSRSAPRRSLLAALGLMLGFVVVAAWLLLKPVAPQQEARYAAR